MHYRTTQITQTMCFWYHCKKCFLCLWLGLIKKNYYRSEYVWSCYEVCQFQTGDLLRMENIKDRDNIIVFIRTIVFQNFGILWLIQTKESTEFIFEM